MKNKDTKSKITPERNPAQAELTTTDMEAPSSTTSQTLRHSYGCSHHNNDYYHRHHFLHKYITVIVVEVLPECELLLGHSRPERDHDGADQNSIELGQPVCYLGVRTGIMFGCWQWRGFSRSSLDWLIGHLVCWLSEVGRGGNS